MYKWYSMLKHDRDSKCNENRAHMSIISYSTILQNPNCNICWKQTLSNFKIFINTIQNCVATVTLNAMKITLTCQHFQKINSRQNSRTCLPYLYALKKKKSSKCVNNSKFVLNEGLAWEKEGYSVVMCPKTWFDNDLQVQFCFYASWICCCG